MPQSARASSQPMFQPNARAVDCTSHGRAQSAKPLSKQSMRSRKRAESERISWPRRLSRGGAVPRFIAARSADNQRAPTSRSARNAAAMIGLMVDAGIASWKTAGFSSASGRYCTRVGEALVAARAATGAIDFLTGARRQGAGQCFDAAAGDIDDGHRRHAHHRAFEQAVADAATAILGALDAERLADIVPAAVAGRGLLRELLQRRIDGEVDRESDIDRRAVEHDAVRAEAVVGGQLGRRRIRIGVQPIQRAGRPAQTFERVQHRLQRRRHSPAIVGDRHVGSGLAGERSEAGRSDARCARHRRQRAQALLRTARAGDVVRRRAVRASRAEVDASGHTVPRVAARHLAGRHRHHLLGTPARDDRCALGAAPGQRLQHAAVRAGQRGQRGREVGASDMEAQAVGTRALRTALQARCRRRRTSGLHRSRPQRRPGVLARVLKRSSTASSAASWAAMRSAFASQSRRHCGRPASRPAAVGVAVVVAWRRTTACSKVFSAARCRTLT